VLCCVVFEVFIVKYFILLYCVVLCCIVLCDIVFYFTLFYILSGNFVMLFCVRGYIPSLQVII